eukprot:10819669-Lingulodinium_polyedra.AAC.1
MLRWAQTVQGGRTRSASSAQGRRRRPSGGLRCGRSAQIGSFQQGSPICAACCEGGGVLKSKAPGSQGATS